MEQMVCATNSPNVLLMLISWIFVLFCEFVTLFRHAVCTTQIASFCNRHTEVSVRPRESVGQKRNRKLRFWMLDVSAWQGMWTKMRRLRYWCGRWRRSYSWIWCRRKMRLHLTKTSLSRIITRTRHCCRRRRRRSRSCLHCRHWWRCLTTLHIILLL